MAECGRRRRGGGNHGRLGGWGLGRGRLGGGGLGRGSRLTGNKIFISGGDHELSENIVHLVLARIQGAPAGVKGISLFIVPKFRVNDDGSLGARNDVNLAGLIHKMGWRGTTSTMLSFGEQGECIGEIVGEPHQGLSYMFQMMNEARIGVGMGAVMLGWRGYLASLAYAQDRPQGRLPDSKNPTEPQRKLIEHADVRRMLLAQKAYVEGAYGLVMYAARLVDEHKTHPDATAREEAARVKRRTPEVIRARGHHSTAQHDGWRHHRHVGNHNCRRHLRPGTPPVLGCLVAKLFARGRINGHADRPIDRADDHRDTATGRLHRHVSLRHQRKHDKRHHQQQAGDPRKAMLAQQAGSHGSGMPAD